MPLHVNIHRVGGKEYVHVAQSYRNSEGKPRSKVIEKHGALKDLLEKDPEYLVKLKARLKAENEAEKQHKADLILEKANERIRRYNEGADSELSKPGSFSTYNVGAAVLHRIWNDLDMPPFFRYLQTKSKFRFPYDKTSFLLVQQRILNPGSKYACFADRIQSILDCSEVDHLEDIYRVLDYLKKDKESIVKHLNKSITKLTGRTLTAAFYDVTTYDFESREQSVLKDFGLSKAHKVNEVQVVLGLIIDENGIPVDYELHKGSTSEFGTMIPIITRMKEDYHLDNLIVVADRGLNSSENLKALKDLKCRFVIAQKVKNCPAEKRAQILNQDNWEQINYNEDGEVLCKYKVLDVDKDIYESKISETTKRKYQTSKVIDTLSVKWVVSHSPARAKKDAADRERAVEKAAKAIQNGSASSLRGYKSYITVPKGEGALTLNNKKIMEEAQWDGYYAICTNMDVKDPHDITRIYRQLWRIEDCFRVSKTMLETRPCYVWTDDHIEGHFVSCFISLVVEKYMLYKFKKEIGSEVTDGRMLDALKEAVVVKDDMDPKQTLYLRLIKGELFDRICTVCGMKPLNKVEEERTLYKKLRIAPR
jgi:transposase